MIIERYSVNLIKIKKEHLELIRYWRNNEKIRNVMEYQGYISEEMQIKWFDKLNETKDLYFVISHHDMLCGLIHISTLHPPTKTAQSGLFIWEDKILGSPIPLIASINILDFYFEVLQQEVIEAKVKHNNFNAISYNAFLGFKETEKYQNQQFVKLQLTKNDYLQHAQKIKTHLDEPGDIPLAISSPTNYWQRLENQYFFKPSKMFQLIIQP